MTEWTAAPSEDVVQPAPAGPQEEEPEAAKVIQGRSPWRLAWERLRRDRVAMVSAVVIVLIAIFVAIAPVFTAITGHGDLNQYPQIGLNSFGQPQAPNATFPFGTDDQGRDLLVRVAYGGRISLIVGVVATGISVGIGVVVGLASGFFGGVIDVVLSRLVDVVLSFPLLLFALAMIAIFGPSTSLLILVIGIFSWAAIARIVRGQVLTIREREYVEAARALGAKSSRIMFVEMLPNVLPEVIVLSTLIIPLSIVAAASLSFLGLGIPPPTPAWGNIVSEARGYYQQAWWFLTFPALGLLLITLSFNLLGDGVRDALDPRSERLFQ
jgi:peptide/nickel transport system permease protein